MKTVMKNLIFILGVLVCGFGLSACKHDPEPQDVEAITSGQLTITGLDAYEGLGINAVAQVEDSGKLLEAAGTAINTYDAADGKTYFKRTIPAIIESSGQVILKVFENSFDSELGYGGFIGYNGDDEELRFTVYIQGGPDTGSGSVTVNFVYGVGSGEFIPDE